MKIAAVIFSCLVLALSVDVGRALSFFGDQATPAQSQCCCDCGCCDGENAANKATNDTGKNCADAAGNAACAFCTGCLAKVLNTASDATVPPMPEGGDSVKSLYVFRVYVPPFVGGIWQPPRSA